MPGKFSQTAVQEQTQQQTLTPQQVIFARLAELPVDGLRERIQKELDDNQWIEVSQGNSASPETDAPASDTAGAVSAEDGYDDDDYEVSPRVASSVTEGQGNREAGDFRETFYDYFARQLVEYNLTNRESEIVRYLIGSLEDDGMLRVPLAQISDELDIYQDIQVGVDELERLLTTVIQQMEPAGIGARNLCECLVIQAKRNYKGAERKRLLELFNNNWDDFSHMRWNKIQASMKLDDHELEELRRRVRRLTPRPGGSIGGERDAGDRTVTPDFFVSVDDDGRLRLRLNEGDLPALTLSPDAEISLNVPILTSADREAMRYLRERVANAKYFIDAVAQRRRSMLLTMKAIMKLQRPFFLTGDEAKLKPMNLEDVSRLTGLNISTTSRISNGKYVQTPYGTYSLRWFFTTAAIKDGGEVSVRNILSALKDIIDNEDKNHPLCDEKLVTLLREKGYSVARRTVAKYRRQLGIPESRLR